MFGFRITETVKHLLIINVIVFIGSMAIGNGTVFYKWLAVYFPLNPDFQPWQIITHMFMHADQSHIFGNMLMLFFIGPMVEMAIGSKRFLFLFISAGLGSVFLSFIVDFIQFQMALTDLIGAGYSKMDIMSTLDDGMYNPGWELTIGESGIKHLVVNFSKASVGASGANMGILAALGLLFPNRELQLIFPPIRLKIKYLVVGMIGSDFLSAIFTGTPLLPDSNTGYVGHVGGAITGFIIIWFWKKNSMNKYRWDK